MTVVGRDSFTQKTAGPKQCEKRHVPSSICTLPRPASHQSQGSCRLASSGLGLGWFGTSKVAHVSHVNYP
jgi:hypothetical protein